MCIRDRAEGGGSEMLEPSRTAKIVLHLSLHSEAGVASVKAGLKYVPEHSGENLNYTLRGMQLRMECGMQLRMECSF